MNLVSYGFQLDVVMLELLGLVSHINNITRIDNYGNHFANTIYFCISMWSLRRIPEKNRGFFLA
jgi:hypothetical protein